MELLIVIMSAAWINCGPCYYPQLGEPGRFCGTWVCVGWKEYHDGKA